MINNYDYELWLKKKKMCDSEQEAVVVECV